MHDLKRLFRFWDSLFLRHILSAQLSQNVYFSNKTEAFLRFLEHIIRRQKILSPLRLSRWLGILADRRLPKPLLRLIILRFANTYHINLKHFECSSVSLRTFNDFFTRRYRPEYLNFSGQLCSPAEGIVVQAGNLEDPVLAKDEVFSLERLLGQPFEAQQILNIYLQLSNYHRVHAPCDLQLKHIRHIPGHKNSVKPSEGMPLETYYTNERLVLDCATSFGRIFLVLVGALAVGKIWLRFRDYDMLVGKSTDHFKKGEEMGMFRMGSTVIVLFDRPLLSARFEKGEAIKLGEALC